MDLEEALAIAEKDMAVLNDRRRSIESQLADLNVEIEGLRRAMKRHGLRPAGGRGRDRVRSMARTEAVEAVLGEASGPMSPNDIVRVLNSLGRDDEYGAVSAALAHLSRTGRAHTVGRGNWRAGPGDSAGNDVVRKHGDHDSGTGGSSGGSGRGPGDRPQVEAVTNKEEE